MPYFYHGGHLTKDLYGAVPSVFGGRSFEEFMQTVIDANGGVLWPFQETSGAYPQAYNTALATGRNVVINGTFASDSVWTKGAGWAIAAGVATHTPGSTAALTQAAIVESGRTYSVTFTISGSTAGSVTAQVGTTGSGTPRSGDGTYIESIVCSGSTSFFFAPSVAFDGNLDDVIVAQTNILASSAYSPFTGNPMTASNTGATIAQGANKLGLAYLFDGSNDYVNAYSNTFNSFFNPAAGTLLCFAKVSAAGVWTDGTLRYMVRLSTDPASSLNSITLRRQTINNTLHAEIAFGGTYKAVSVVTTTVNWFLLAITWDKSADQAKIYFNGTQSGITQTALGTFVGNLSATAVCVGAGATTPANVWSGLIAYPTLFRVALTPTQILEIAQRGGVA